MGAWGKAEAIPRGRASWTSGGSGSTEFRHGRRAVTHDAANEGTTMRRRLWLGAAATLPLIGFAITSGGAVPAGAASSGHSAHAASVPTTGLAAGNPFCKKLANGYWASSGAHMFCFGAQPNGPAAPHAPAARSAGA